MYSGLAHGVDQAKNNCYEFVYLIVVFQIQAKKLSDVWEIGIQCRRQGKATLNAFRMQKNSCLFLSKQSRPALTPTLAISGNIFPHVESVVVGEEDS